MAAVDGERLNGGETGAGEADKTARCCQSVCVCADEYAPQQLKEEAERVGSGEREGRAYESMRVQIRFIINELVGRV